MHRAVEEGNLTLLMLLIQSGCDINEKEGCGITPLILAICDGHTDTVGLLIQRHVCIKESFYQSVPDPITVAKKLQNKEIIDLLKKWTPSPEEDIMLKDDV